MKQYKYEGLEEVELVGFGVVKPEEVISTSIEVNHPLFKEVKEEKKGKTK